MVMFFLKLRKIMENGMIMIFKQYQDMAPLVTFVQNKTVFIGGDVIEKPYALIALHKNRVEFAEIDIERIKSEIIEKDTLLNFTETNSSNLFQLHLEAKQLGYDLSWLQTMQILLLAKDNTESLEVLIKKLEAFYTNNIIEDFKINDI
jgi:hypothetical protein